MTVAITLNKKLIFLVTMVGLFALAVTGYVSYDHATNVITTNTYNQLEGEARTHGATLQVLLESRLVQNGILASDPQVQKLAMQHKAEHDEMENGDTANAQTGHDIHHEKYRAEFLRLIQSFEERTGYSMPIEDITILDKDGNSVFVLHDDHDTWEHDHKYYNMMEEKKSFVIFEEGYHGPTLVVVSHMVNEDTNESAGIVISRTTASIIYNTLLANSGLGDDGEIYLVGHDKQMISKSKFIDNAMFHTIIDNKGVDQCLNDGSSHTGLHTSYRDVEVYAATYCAQNLGLVLFAEVGKDTVEAPLTKLQNNIVQAGVIIMAGMGGLAILVARTISKPICRLKTVAGEIAGGNFDVKSEIHARDEIGDLAGEFDIMANKLKESMNRLREKEGVIRQQEGVLLQFSSHSEKYCVGMIDIMNSTKTCAKMSDTQMSEFYKIFINSMGLIVQKYEGVVVKNIGDALLFYFSIYGHDEKQILKKCIDCCTNMCEIHDRVARRLKRADLPAMNYRISTTYGIVRIAKSSTSLVEDIFGTTVNRCSKINRSAPPNGVVIDEYFYEAAKDIKEYEFQKVEKDAVLTDHGYTCYTVKKKTVVAKAPPVSKATEKVTV